MGLKRILSWHRAALTWLCKDSFEAALSKYCQSCNILVWLHCLHTEFWASCLNLTPKWQKAFVFLNTLRNIHTTFNIILCFSLLHYNIHTYIINVDLYTTIFIVTYYKIFRIWKQSTKNFTKHLLFILFFWPHSERKTKERRKNRQIYFWYQPCQQKGIKMNREALTCHY